MTRFLVNVSGGVPSAVALERTLARARVDRKEVVAVFADVKSEDGDLYRFLDDVEKYLNHPIQRIADGRSVWDVFFDEKMMGNNRADLCSRILKRELIDSWIASQGYTPADTVRVFGFGMKEMGRVDAIRRAVAPFPVWIPLHEAPYLSNCECIEYVQDAWGIDPPDLYGDGFPHNNCGGVCVKAGHGQWYLAYRKRRSVFDMWEQKEEEFRCMTGKDVSILRDRRNGSNSPMPLSELRRRFEQEGYRPADVRGGCNCMGVQDA